MNDQETMIIWEAPKIDKPELRLYYDDAGDVVTYTCDKLPGNFIIVEPQVYAEARYDIKVIDGKIVKKIPGTYVSRLFPSIDGVLCEREDVSIITNSDGQFWKLKTYEL